CLFFKPDSFPKFADIKRLHSLDNDVRASGFSKELEKQFEQVSETIGLRQDVDNDNHSVEEENDDDDDDDEDEEIDEEPTSSLPENDEMNKLTQMIDSNHLLSSPILDENENHQFKPFQDDNKQEFEENNDHDDNQSTISTSQKLAELSIDKNYIRAKVKQTLKKKLKQQHRRLCTKGEAALVTAQRRDHRDTIQLHLE
ncbi:unnamed protein product, partial [Rotaria sordida]